MAKIVSLSWLATVALLLVSYQNCSKPMFNGEGSSSSSQRASLDSGGQPYDGKIYVERGAACSSDGTIIRSRIVLESKTTGHVVRENCENITPRRIAAGEFTLDPVNANSLIYRNITFVAERPVVVVEPKASWYYQLSGTIPARTESVLNVDMFSHTLTSIQNLKADNHVVICSFSAGTVESSRPDASSFASSDRGNQADGNNEWWLDTRSASVRAAMLKRLDRAKGIGCDGIDFDRTDAHSNGSGFPLNAATQVDYNRFLAFAAHDRGLLAGLKNTGDLASRLADVFDLSIVEQCNQYRECDQYQPFAALNKPILAVEYTAYSSSQCSSADASGISLIFSTSALDGSRHQSCQ